MNEYNKIIKDIGGLETCLKTEGVSEKEIVETRKLYLEKNTRTTNAYKTLEAYRDYMLIRYNNLKQYWEKRWMK